MIRPFFWTLALAGTLASGAAAGKEPVSLQQLGYGYASLYGATRSLRHSDKIFLVKFESPPVEKVVSDLSETMGRITQRLEKLAAADPRINLEDDGLPVIETRKRDAVTRARLLSFKPLTGRTGTNFERTLLLSESGALNQLKFLVAELDAADSDPQRSAVLKEIHRDLVRLYEDVVGLLDRQYFK